MKINSPFANHKDEGTVSRYHLNSGQSCPALEPVNAEIRNPYCSRADISDLYRKFREEAPKLHRTFPAAKPLSDRFRSLIPSLYDLFFTAVHIQIICSYYSGFQKSRQ